MYSLDRNYDVNMMLLQNGLGAMISFKFYYPNTTIPMAGGFVDMNKPDRNGYSIGQENVAENAEQYFNQTFNPK
jgi:hypothetical protein